MGRKEVFVLARGLASYSKSIRRGIMVGRNAVKEEAGVSQSGTVDGTMDGWRGREEVGTR